MKNLLICGATGFIGKNLVLHYSKKKIYKVFAVYNNKKPFKCKGVRWIKCDLRDESKVSNLIKDKQIVIQAAATTSGAKDIVNKPYIHVTDNAVMNSYILRSCYEHKVKNFIFFSCTVMLKSQKKPQTEKEFNLNNKIYPNYFGVGWTKIFIEKQCEFYSKISNTKFTVIRHSNIYGPHDKFDLEKSHFFGATINKVLNNKNGKIIVWGKGNEERDILYIDDLVRFVDLSIKNQKKNYELFNCGYGKSFKVIDIIKKIIKFSKKKIVIENDLTKKSLSTYLSLNCAKSKKVIGWKKKNSIDIGILKTIKWYLKNEKKKL